MINANEYGFLPENNAYKNSEALQKAIDGGGEIEIGIYEEEEHLHIAIRDRGKGVSPNVREKLFKTKWLANYFI